MSKNIFLFSGQGSQYVGMAKELCEKYDAANAVFDTAEKVLGYDLRAVTFDDPDTELNKKIFFDIKFYSFVVKFIHSRLIISKPPYLISVNF